MGQVPGFRVIVYVSVPIALSGQKSPITRLVLVSSLIKGRDIQLGERNSVGRGGRNAESRRFVTSFRFYSSSATNCIRRELGNAASAIISRQLGGPVASISSRRRGLVHKRRLLCR